MYERFTDRARKVMQFAQQVAQTLNHEYIGTEHVLLGMLKCGEGMGITALRNFNVDLKALEEATRKFLKAGPDMVTMGKLPQTPRTKRVIELSMQAASELSCNFIGTEHILIGLVREQEGIAAIVLSLFRVTDAALMKEIQSLLGRGSHEETLQQAVNEFAEKAKSYRILIEKADLSPSSTDRERVLVFYIRKMIRGLLASDPERSMAYAKHLVEFLKTDGHADLAGQIQSAIDGSGRVTTISY